MALGDVKKAHVAAVNLTVTALQGLANAGSAHLIGWQSDVIDHSGASEQYLDDRITAKITVESAGLAAGELRIHIVLMLDDSNWPDVFTGGGQAAKTVTDENVRNAICLLGAACATDTTASQVYYLVIPSVAAVCGGNMPEKYLLFVTQSTATTLETTGQQITRKASYETVALS